MKTCIIILIEKMQKYRHYHNKKYKYDSLTDKQTLPPNQKMLIGLATFILPLFGKAFESKKILLKNKGKKLRPLHPLESSKQQIQQLNLIKDLFSLGFLGQLKKVSQK